MWGRKRREGFAQDVASRVIDAVREFDRSVNTLAEERHAEVVAILEGQREEPKQTAAWPETDARCVPDVGHSMTLTGLPGVAPKEGGVDTALAVLGSSAAPHARGAIEVKPRESTVVSEVPAAGTVIGNRVAAQRYGVNQAELVEALRNGDIPGAVKRPGRAGGWSAPDAAISAWASTNAE